MLATGGGELIDLHNGTEFRKWLEGKSLEWVRVLALRSALRALPAIGSLQEDDSGRAARLRLGIFRALVVAWAASEGIPNASGAAYFAALGVGADAAALGAAGAAYAAAGYAARGAFGTVAENAYSTAAAATDAAFSAAGAAFAAADAVVVWSVLHRDVDRLEVVLAEPVEARLRREALWANAGPCRMPQSYVTAWEAVSGRMLALDPNSRVWIDWYIRRLEGSPSSFGLPAEADRAVLLRIIEQRNIFWDRDPRVVNADIAGWIEQVSHPIEKESVSITASDFFISYAGPNEAMAREINAIVQEAGYTTIAQFKDFGPGDNFVREMQRGLVSSGRLIALLSPAYEASDHCQAEWSAAYTQDPGSAKGRIIPFLIEPTQLNPLARQIVYASLVGQGPAERKATILRALGHISRKRPLEEVRREAARVASPDVDVRHDQFDALPNVATDMATAGPALPDLPATLREILGAIVDALPANAPAAVRTCCDRYQRHLAERGARPILGLLDAMASPVEREFRSVEMELWGKGLGDLFASFFAHHAQFHGHFPEADQREKLFSETPIDEAKASGSALSEPIREASEALGQLSEAGLTTPQFDAIVAGQQQQANDLASLPLQQDDQPSTIITPKRRFVLSSIGFYERVLIAAAATTTISAAPAAQAAIPVIAHTIERLLALLL